MPEVVPVELITNKIFNIRGLKVMLDRDLAKLYEVETKVLKRNVRRHIDRFLMILCLNLQNLNYKIGGANLAPPILINCHGQTSL